MCSCMSITALIKVLTPVVTVNNLAVKVDECPLNLGCYVLFVYNWECEKCPLYGVAGCPLFRGF